MRWHAAGLAVLLISCGRSEENMGLAVRRAALQELVTMMEAPGYSWKAACIALDSAASVDGLHEPPDGFTESLRSSRLALRTFGTCVKNPGQPGFTWRNTTAGAREEVLVAVAAVDSIGEARAVVDVLWLASGAEGEDYRCVVLKDESGWTAQECKLTGYS